MAQPALGGSMWWAVATGQVAALRVGISAESPRARLKAGSAAVMAMKDLRVHVQRATSPALAHPRVS